MNEYKETNYVVMKGKFCELGMCEMEKVEQRKNLSTLETKTVRRRWTEDEIERSSWVLRSKVVDNSFCGREGYVAMLMLTMLYRCEGNLLCVEIWVCKWSE